MDDDLFTAVESLWAKKRRTRDGQQLWLPLLVHLHDTKSAINWLFNNYLNAGQRQFLTTTLSEEEAQKLVKFIGFIHDSGKATAAFQIKSSHEGDYDLDDRIKERLIQNGFPEGLQGLKLFTAKNSPHARAGEALLKDAGCPESVCAIIGGHHGRPEPLSPEPEQTQSYPNNYFQDNKKPAVKGMWQRVQNAIIEEGLREAGYSNISEIPEVNEPQAVLLEGLLIMADWLASSEYLDTDEKIPLFPLIGLDDFGDHLDLDARFRHAIHAWKRGNKWLPQPVEIDQNHDPYQKRWGFKARPVQRRITEEISRTVDPGMIIVEAGMGLGKTEIALIAAEQLADITGRDAVYWGLPTQATSNAMFSRVEQWMGKLAEDEKGSLPIKLMHGKAAFNEEYVQIPDATNVDEFADGSTPDTGSVIVNSWFSGKKATLSPFIVGTIDNLLLMGLRQKHLFLRHLGFSGKAAVIIDEAHAFDAYMNQYLYKAVRWLGAYHVPVIILSATLPKRKRNQLLEAYLKGKYGIDYTLSQKPDDWRNEGSYPLLSILDGNRLKQITNFGGGGDQKPLTLQIHRFTGDDEALIQSVLSKISDGGVAGIIVNTVKRAQTLAKLLPQDVESLVLHSAFLAPDRVAREQELQRKIGKHGERPHRLIVVGTQVLEQSLDIDFDILYTDIAPMDLILQRAGRLHRHAIKRPPLLVTPQVYVMGIAGSGDYGDANEAIYAKYLLMRTDYYLPDTICLPTDISSLVQKVYDEKTEVPMSGMKAEFAKFKRKQADKKDKAKVFQICRPDFRPGATIHGWLDREASPKLLSDTKAEAMVRDIQEALEVVMLRQTSAGSCLLDGRPLATVSHKEIARQVIRIPTAITQGSGKLIAVINYLEGQTHQLYSDWQESKWLRGSLALTLDTNQSAQLKGWRLMYSTTLGLSYEREDEDE